MREKYLVQNATKIPDLGIQHSQHCCWIKLIFPRFRSMEREQVLPIFGHPRSGNDRTGSHHPGSHNPGSHNSGSARFPARPDEYWSRLAGSEPVATGWECCQPRLADWPELWSKESHQSEDRGGCQKAKKSPVCWCSSNLRICRRGWGFFFASRCQAKLKRQRTQLF